MAKKSKKRLIEGRAYHRTKDCELCQGELPPIRSIIDEENGLEIIDRHVECQEHIVDFSVGLKCKYKGTSTKPFVLRSCSSHRNFHTHYWNPLYPFSKHGMVDEHHPINSAEEANEAYIEACRKVAFEGVVIWQQKWEKFKPR